MKVIRCNRCKEKYQERAASKLIHILDYDEDAAVRESKTYELCDDCHDNFVLWLTRSLKRRKVEPALTVEGCECEYCKMHRVGDHGN